jgi:hypothetical protein
MYCKTSIKGTFSQKYTVRPQLKTLFLRNILHILNLWHSISEMYCKTSIKGTLSQKYTVSPQLKTLSH